MGTDIHLGLNEGHSRKAEAARPWYQLPRTEHLGLRPVLGALCTQRLT